MKKVVFEILYRVLNTTERRYHRFRDSIYIATLLPKLGKCGKDVHILYPSFISDPQCVEIGNNVHINRGAFIRAGGGLTIGDNVHIARNLVLYTVNHNYIGDALPYDETSLKKPVMIEKNVWIGINVTIVPGVTIGEGAIIGAGTVVANNVPPLAIVGSAPLRIIKYRDDDHYRRLEQNQKYGGSGGKKYILCDAEK